MSDTIKTEKPKPAALKKWRKPSVYDEAVALAELVDAEHGALLTCEEYPAGTKPAHVRMATLAQMILGKRDGAKS
mgnify:CR=1 FL=1